MWLGIVQESGIQLFLIIRIIDAAANSAEIVNRASNFVNGFL